jgi:hypothetical protein
MGYRADGASKMLNFGTCLEAVRYRKEFERAEPLAAADAKSR